MKHQRVIHAQCAMYHIYMHTQAFEVWLQWDISFDTMLIGFSLDLSALPKLSCSTDKTYKCLGSQLWAFLSSEESKKAITVSQP